MDWNVGDFCVAKSSKFEDLYNAKILEFLPNDSKAKVSFIEYGDIEEVLLSDLKPFGEFSINKAGDLVRGDQRSSEGVWPGNWNVWDDCVAWWDGDKTWNNAKILKIFSPEEVLVYFTEHGNADFTSFKDLKELEDTGEAKTKEDTELSPKPSGDNAATKAIMSSWRVGDLCVAKWEEDDVWYRSKIIEIDGDNVLVEFVEYGNKDYTTIGELKPKDALDEKGENEAKEVMKEKEEIWKIGDLCVAKWDEDNVWYRSKILEIDGESVLVKFVEYGNEDYTTLGELKPKDALDEKGENRTRIVEKEEAKIWKIGDLCVAKSSQFEGFFNGQILEIGNNTALVEFIEYAREEKIPFEDLKPFGPFSVNKSGDLVKGVTSHSEASGWKDGDLCVSPWETDKNLYNAKILKIFNKDEVLVQFVDHGNADFTSLSSLKPAGFSLKKTGDLLNKGIKKDVEVPNKKKSETSSTSESKKSTVSKEKFPERQSASNKKIEEKVQAVDLEKIEAGKWTGESRKKTFKPRPLFKSDKDVEPKIIQPPPPHVQSEDSSVKAKLKPELSQTDLSPIISQKVKLGSSQTLRRPAALPNVSSLPDNSNLGTICSPDNSNLATASLPEISNSVKVSLPDISTMPALALTTSGSRYLQSIIPQMTTRDINKLQDELMKTPLDVMKHSTATFVIQNLLEVGDSSRLELCVSTVEENFLSLSVHPAGCRVVQKCLALANTDQKNRIGLMLENYRVLIKLLRNKNGTYVAQALLPTLPVRTTTFIVNSLLGHMVYIGRNQHGTFFIQKLVTGKAGGQVSVQLLVEEIVNNVGYLGHDEFGTRLVQEVLTSSSSPDVISGLSEWVRTNMTAVFRSSPAVFLAKAVVHKLAALSHDKVCLELLEKLVVSSLETRVDDQPLVVAASLHPVGHGLAKEIVKLVTIVPSRHNLLNTIKKFTLPLKQDSFGRLVLKELEGRI